jgi:hypothetical protein
MEPVEQDSSPNIDLSAIIRTMQIITGALIAGVSFYAIFTLEPADGELEMMGMIALAFAAVMIIARFIVPGLIGDPGTLVTAGELLGLYQTRMIVGLALLEGAAFFNITAFNMEHHWSSLMIAGILMFLMLSSWPTRSKIELWIRIQRELAGLDETE